MKITAYKTHKIQPNENLFEILDKYLPTLQEKSVIAIASKIVGICEGRVIKKVSQKQKDELIKKEADCYLPRESNKYGTMLTINHNLIVVDAGIDESNSKNHLSLWPENPQKSVNLIREYLIKKHKLKNLGVILTDSKLTPLRWGITGYAIVHSGFNAINSYIGKPDIFGRIMQKEKANISDSLAAATVIVTGEGNEQQPFAIITDVPFINFQKRNPTQKELENLQIKMEDDIYSALLTGVEWKKGIKKS